MTRSSTKKQNRAQSVDGRIVMSKLTSLLTGISRLPSFLWGLLIIAVLLGGAAAAVGMYVKCGSQSWGTCLLSSINPIPASYGRGAGEPLRCAPNEDLDGALCYPKCQAGYKGVGPVCWQDCPSGFRDDGGFCAKPESYGRGTGYPWQFGDPVDDSGMFNRCTAAHGAGSCEKSGAIVYPKCRANFHAVGCCVCSPDCPSGMADIGASCTKKSVGRGAGVPIHACADNMDKDGALCYPKCKAGFHGVGPVCWETKT
jgi:hypothetical protein